MMQPFKLTPKQNEANKLLGSSAMHTLLYGGSRSGKTFLMTRATCIRALRLESRHAFLRYRFNHIKESMVFDTFPKVMKTCFPEVPYELNKSDWFARLPNGSEIWFGGLDDKDRTDKILGKEFATLGFEEVSQISFASVETALSRLAQKTGLALKAYYSENPPSKGHWTYKLFKQLINPASNTPVPDPANYQSILMNPDDNRDNIAPEYLRILDNMSGARRKRFRDGDFADDNPNALWSIEVFERNRLVNEQPPDMLRIVVSVDPSGSDDVDNQANDAIGIVVMGLGTDGKAYLLEDLTMKGGPQTWGKVAANAFDRHAADCIVVETNFGGAMVKNVIHTARPNTPVREVRASRGKVVRAEPISALSHDGKVKHVGYFPELEDELMGFSTTGYMGESSPNRADAYVWAVSELFPRMMNTERGVFVPPKNVVVPMVSAGWMAQ